MQSNITIEFIKSLAAVQSEMPPAIFDSTNPFLKNRYASLGALISASKAILFKHGFAVVQVPFSSPEKGTVGIETTLLHISGGYISSMLEMKVWDEKGKSPSQIVGTILSYARRYQYAPILGMYGEEDMDGNIPSGKSTNPSNRFRTPAEGKTNASLPEATEESKKRFLEMLFPISDLALKHFIDSGVLLPTESLDDLPISKVPRTKGEAKSIMRQIESLIPNSQPEPAFFAFIIRIPPKGVSRDEYMKNPDTIGSLYKSAQSGDDNAAHRLFGFAEKWTPKAWTNKDGKVCPPSDSDLELRKHLDLFKEWHKSQKKDEAL